MALFGARVAHEDDPERAVRAGLAIRDWVGEQEELQVRIAVNTGEALADEHLRKALEFYRSVGATQYVRECETLLAASA